MPTSFKKLVTTSNKIIITTSISLFVTFIFAIYNFYLGIRFFDSWGISISIYYLCLIIARAISVYCELKLKTQDKLTQGVIRKRNYIALSVFMFFIDISLMVPIALMIFKPKDVKFGIIPAITVATYTTYKVTMAIINFCKVNKTNNLSFKFLRELSVVDALVSILTLQHTLIMVNGGMTDSMKTLSIISSIGIFIVIIIFSVLTMVKTLKNTNQQAKP